MNVNNAILSEKAQTVSKDVVKGILDNLSDIIDEVVLYGSYARGDYTDESDIDFMVIMNCPPEEVPQYRRQACKVSSRIGLENDIVVSIMLQDRQTFDRWLGAEIFFQNVKRDGIVLYG